MRRSRCSARLAALVTLGSLAACGGDERAPDPAGGPAASPAFMPAGPLEDDIWLADLSWEASGQPSLGQPVNLTERPGYDNQPAFVPDGSGLWYTAVDVHDGQTDIWRFDFAPGSVARVTMSNPESEYSATPLPDGSGISAVRVEADSTQRLWRFDPDGSNAAVLLEDVAPVGYHAWADAGTLVLFVLGEPASLVVADVGTGATEVVARDIGRSIQPIPGSANVSFVQRAADGGSTIMRLRPSTGAIEPLIDAVEGGDFHAWAPNGTLLMAHESAMFAWRPGDEGWRQVADFASLGLSITRLAVSPDGAQIALVARVGM